MLWRVIQFLPTGLTMQAFLWKTFFFVLLIQRSLARLLVEPCGASELSERIMDGGNADEEASAWMAGISNEEGFICGGTVIHRSFVLTAAHCIKDQTKLFVKVGAYNISRPTAEYSVSKAIMHHGYNRVSMQHDIGLLKLSRDIAFSWQVYPICIILSPSMKSKVEKVHHFKAYGWGKTKDANKSTLLQQVTLDRYDRSICDKSLYRPLTSNQLCAGSSHGDTCNGDSGGPLTKKVPINGLKRQTQLGIVSFGLVDCNGEGIYTDVSSYADWIQEKVNQFQTRHTGGEGITGFSGIVRPNLGRSALESGSRPYPPPGLATNPPSHKTDLHYRPPPGFATYRPPPGFATNPSPPPGFATYRPPPGFATNPSPPPGFATYRPPPGFATNPSPPPGFATYRPPPGFATNPSPPPGFASHRSPVGFAASTPPAQTTRRAMFLYNQCGGDNIALNLVVNIYGFEFEAKGVMITDRYVLTNAKDLPSEAGSLEVSTGSGESYEEWRVESITKHPAFSGDYKYDIALLKLTKPMSFTGRRKPICMLLQARHRAQAAQAPQLTIFDYRPPSAIPLLIKSIDSGECSTRVGQQIQPDQLCIEERANMTVKYGHTGDILGAQMRYSDKNWYILFGIVSYSSNGLHVLTNVMKYTDWIADVVMELS